MRPSRSVCSNRQPRRSRSSIAIPLQDGAKDVNVVVTFKNSEANDLGMPLPAGKIRLTKLDTDGSEEFLGEDQIDHTPKDEEVELKVGNAFDVVGETNTIDSKRIY